MRRGEPDTRRGVSIAWSLLISMLPFLILIFMIDNESVMKGLVYISNITYYGVFLIWGWVSSLLGSAVTRLFEKKWR